MSTLLQQLQQLAPLAAATTDGAAENYLAMADAALIIVHGRTASAPACQWLFDAAAARNLLTPENLALLIGALTTSADAPR